MGLALDLDGDDRSNWQELQDGTAGLRADTDRDGLSDGDEARLGLDPLRDDMDGDGVRDGFERALQCVRATDCDQDALPDGAEIGGYDSLDPDSFDVGLADGVVAAFEAAGQPASPDRDMDGIPDGWEDTDGLIAWGPFTPVADRTDLLVEFLRVEGPQSGRFALDFDPAYDAVADLFASRDIHLQWIETVVDTASEHRPDFLTVDEAGYYDAVLAEGRASTNPFVTTIILNPQQTQADLAGDILGAAFLRSMIATVDYGAHTVVSFGEAGAQGLTLNGETIELTPALESHVVAAPREQLRAIRFASEGIVDLGFDADGTTWIVTRQADMDDDGRREHFTWTWQRDWFRQAPNITWQERPGDYLQLRIDDVEVQMDDLASTIAHELGHTLGLCHAHEADCYLEFHPDDIRIEAIDGTTMSYTAPPGTMHFLDSEWRQVRDYLQCPPQAPVAFVAAGADDADLLYAKYLASFEQQLDLRACGDADPVPADLPAPLVRSTVADGIGWLGFYVTGVAAAAAVAWWRAGGSG